jgi:hypothetical protein
VSCLPSTGLPLQCSHCRHPPAEYTSMLLSVHAIRGGASTPTAQQPRRRPRTAGDRAGKQNRRFIGALVERFGHFSDLFLHLVALHGRKTKPKPRPCHCPRETKTHVIVVYRRWRALVRRHFARASCGGRTAAAGGSDHPQVRCGSSRRVRRPPRRWSARTGRPRGRGHRQCARLRRAAGIL